jgi:hypothetical protein
VLNTIGKGLRLQIASFHFFSGTLKGRNGLGNKARWILRLVIEINVQGYYVLVWVESATASELLAPPHSHIKVICTEGVLGQYPGGEYFLNQLIRLLIRYGGGGFFQYLIFFCDVYTFVPSELTALLSGSMSRVLEDYDASVCKEFYSDDALPPHPGVTR